MPPRFFGWPSRSRLLSTVLVALPAAGVARAAPPELALAVLAAALLTVLYLLRPRTLLARRRTRMDAGPSERVFADRLERYARALERELDKLDLESNWTNDNFVPLDAEVEVRATRRRNRRRKDLLSAIRADRRSRLFLLLGDPGSGKSVVLRRLWRELLAEAGATQTLPVYVNLREWAPRTPWTPDTPPTAAEVYAFVLENLAARADVFGADFLADYFKPMMDRGMLFLILDSFDEIPAVLDAAEDSWLLDALSDAIDQFLQGSHESRGIVASRRFRQPTRKLGARTVLEIRPLTERKIATLFQRALSGMDGGRTVRRLFHEHRELVPIARNPFTASLITAYAREHDYSLPRTQSELYESFIERRLGACGERLRALGLTAAEVLETARDAAAAMFTAEQLGLEAPVEMVVAALPGRPVEPVVELLAFARLGRLSGSERNFSFVHRRFAEYFVVQWMRQDSARAPEESIPTDSRFRDALALYCEVAEPEDATRFAVHAATQIERGGLTNAAASTDAYRSAVHGLRFLTDAFRSRPECIAPIRASLSAVILSVLDSRKSGLVSKKLAVEGVGLLDEESMRKCLLAAVKLKNAWIDETVFRSCQFLTTADARVNAELCASISRIPWYRFVTRAPDLLFALSLTEAFSLARWFCRLRVLNLAIIAAAAAWLLVTAPFPFLVLAVLILVFETLSITSILARSHKTFFYIIFVLGVGVIASGVFSRPELGGYDSLARNIALSAAACALILPFYEVLRLPSAGVLLRELVKLALALGVLWLLWRLLLVLRALLVPRLGLAELWVLAFGPYVLWKGWQSLAWLVRSARDCGTVLRFGVPHPEMSRTQIQQRWTDMHTAWGRLAYVRWLREHRVRATGAWPENLPHDDGEAGTLLAQLEEGWLGLSR